MRFLKRWVHTALLISLVLSGIPHPLMATVSAPDGRIAFVSDRDGNAEIYVMNADGSAVTRLTHDPADDKAPAWSPDGRRIAFESNRDGPTEIYVMNADGSNVIRLTYQDAGRYASQPAWSPDGDWIAFVSNRHTTTHAGWSIGDIYVMRADGSDVRNLTNSPGPENYPTWSPDGARIAFAFNRSLRVMNADGTNESGLVGTSAAYPAWSPDGTRIAYMGMSSTSGAKICVGFLGERGRGIQCLVNSSSDDRPAWSPDSNHLAYVASGDIYVMGADGSGMINLTNHTAKDSQPAWAVSAELTLGQQTRMALNITSPVDGARLLRCTIDITGQAPPGSTVVVNNAENITPPPGPGGIGIIWVNTVGQATADDTGVWQIPQAQLRWGDNYLRVDPEPQVDETTPTEYVHVVCRKPQVIFADPPAGASGVPLDLRGAPIAFRFDVPMDSDTINSESVWLSSETLDQWRGTITSVQYEGDTQPTYLFTPLKQLDQATVYTVYLSERIRAAVPDTDVTIDPIYWDFITTGMARDKLVEAIRDLADVASLKIERDVETTAQTLVGVSDIQDSVNRADFFTAIMSILDYMANLPKSWGDLKNLLNPKTITSIVNIAMLAFRTYTTSADVLRAASEGDMLHQVCVTESDCQQYKSAISQGEGVLEDLLYGIPGPSPLQMTISGGLVHENVASHTIYGASSLQSDIGRQADALILMLPDPLPSDFPADEIYGELVRLRKALRSSTTNWVDITYSAPCPAATRGPCFATTSMGNIGARRKDGQLLFEAFENRTTLDIVITVYKGVSLSASVLIGPSEGFRPGISDSKIAKRFIAWNWPLGPQVDISTSDIVDATELLLVDPRDALAQLPVTMLVELPDELAATHAIVANTFVSIADKLSASPTSQLETPDWLTFLWSATPVYAAELETIHSAPDLTVTAFGLDDAVVAEGHSIGLGHGQCTVTNKSDAPWRVGARMQILPLNPVGQARPELGYGFSSTSVVIEPGQTETLGLDYHVLAPVLTGQVDIEALLTLDIMPLAEGWPQTLGPFSRIVRTGTAEQLAALPPAEAQPVLAGELAIGEVHTTTLNLSPDAPALILLSHTSGISLSMSLEDGAGNRVALNGLGDPASFEGLSGSYGAGAEYQWIRLDAAPAEPLVLAVSGVLSRQGRGLRYQAQVIPGEARAVDTDWEAFAVSEPAPLPDVPVPAPDAPVQPPAVDTAAPSAGGGFGLAIVLLLVGAGGMAIFVSTRKRRSAGPHLIGLSGAWSGQRVPVPLAGLTIGRAAGNGLRLADPAVAPQHATLRYARGQWFLQDPGGASGLWVNGQAVAAAALRDGDRIRIGATEWLFRA